ncbi:hypothetical protein [Bacillus cereus]
MYIVSPIVKTYETSEGNITLHIPNVKYGKENDLLKISRLMFVKKMINNIAIGGFDVVSIVEDAGVCSIFITKCCNTECDNTVDWQYQFYITKEKVPLCILCTQLITSTKRNTNRKCKRPIIAIKCSEIIEFSSVVDAGRKFNIIKQYVHVCLRRDVTHRPGYRFAYAD